MTDNNDVQTRSIVRNVWMSLAIFLSIFGNLLLIMVISRRQRFHNVTNVYNLNLSFSDLLKVIFYIPVYLIVAERRSWPYGLGGCQALNVILYTSFGVTVLTLMSLSFERYHLILHPTKKQMTVKKALITVVITWLASLSVNLCMIP
ncbi:neuropeptide FF receptor 1-like, partial [Actinia tenebrosa]|uniref:Neuropeptide FF receptor 1-like n=1 Tax=Actinia tenebrosa TaxID=6105 RepID=A0A6P8H9G5_ACTTE